MDAPGFVQFEWVEGKKASDTLVRECSDLYSQHYGIYGEGAPSPGDKIRLSPGRIRALLQGDGNWASLARQNGFLIGYAFLLRSHIPTYGAISWVTQLVVHAEFRNKKIATRLLNSVWCFSNNFAWGLATANPYAVRALETATRRRCDTEPIAFYLDELRQYGANRISYIRNRSFLVSSGRSIVDTEFFVSHDRLGEMMKLSSSANKPWTLGELGPGQEWLAFTFRTQTPRRLTQGEFNLALQDHEMIVKEAYARMTLDHAHKWAAQAPAEMEFAIKHLQLRPGCSVLDAGCQTGRHSIELAKRGYRATGVDFVPSFVERASAIAAASGLSESAKFVSADCRHLSLGERFDGALCLYDVVGTFADDSDNRILLGGVANHLKRGGRLLLSVMNREMVDAQAVHKGPIWENLDILQKLPPNSLMQKSGEVFDPNYYFFDPETSLVYRKEQFEDEQLPTELIVRDRRYSGPQIEELCRNVGISPLWLRYVRAGHWDKNMAPQQAKEILLLGVKD